MEAIKVLIVDDSALIRQILRDILSADKRFLVVGTARDGVDALEKIEKLRPQIITLDVEMPRMDGLQTLKEIIRRYRIPVIMISSMTQRSSAVTVNALALGAVDFVPKPESINDEAKKNMEKELIEKALAAVGAQVCPVTPEPRPSGETSQRVSPMMPARRVVAIGTSTGGPKALEVVLTALPATLPAALLVTQHMPANFTRALAERLDKVSDIRIKEAEHGEPVMTGVAYLAPGNYHMEVDRQERIRITQDPPVEHVRPSATVMMRSVADIYGKAVIGVILTGMGKDGAAGMMDIKQKGGTTIVQDEATAVIFSMPRSVIQLHAADNVLPLGAIADKIITLCRGNNNGAGHGLRGF
jgi:two-component system chemotaxis response regulator CheB